ncbi:hypothetical protein KUH03_27175 [Sphingobacterium sp. E70]|nr:hypothetical protein [Sphingobacterium sp. E70]ULT22932.1 hypothetical protein KUH03_27175 [Sphingobacterium sp. E70]
MFSQFVSMLRLIKEALDKNGIASLTLTGQSRNRGSWSAISKRIKISVFFSLVSKLAGRVLISQQQMLSIWSIHGGIQPLNNRRSTVAIVLANERMSPPFV